MNDRHRGTRFRSFLIGGLLGSAAGLAAAGQVKVRRRRRLPGSSAGLAAFESAPCFRELSEGDEASQPERPGR